MEWPLENPANMAGKELNFAISIDPNEATESN
jgi:hypothetical protein